VHHAIIEVQKYLSYPLMYFYRIVWSQKKEYLRRQDLQQLHDYERQALLALGLELVDWLLSVWHRVHQAQLRN